MPYFVVRRFAQYGVWRKNKRELRIRWIDTGQGPELPIR